MLFGDMSEIPAPARRRDHQGLYCKPPVLALAALAFATVGRLRYAIMALGALVLMTWLNFMPSVVRHGLDFDGSPPSRRPSGSSRFR
jgi:hypothetical protein